VARLTERLRRRPRARTPPTSGARNPGCPTRPEPRCRFDPHVPSIAVAYGLAFVVTFHTTHLAGLLFHDGRRTWRAVHSSTNRPAAWGFRGSRSNRGRVATGSSPVEWHRDPHRHRLETPTVATVRARGPGVPVTWDDARRGLAGRTSGEAGRRQTWGHAPKTPSGASTRACSSTSTAKHHPRFGARP